VHLTSDVLNFGTTLNDTRKEETLTVTNTSEVPVKYHWELFDADAITTPAAKSKQGTHLSSAPAAQLFDIKPIEGFLHPGEQETVRFSYFAHAGKRAAAKAVMRLRGGPISTVLLQAAPNRIQCTLEPRSVDCGSVLYNKVTFKEIVITNPSRYVNASRLCLLSSCKA
jgi:hydrocephalus-inducing protein